MDDLKNEIALIHSGSIRSFVENVLSHAPAYFWTAPSSSSGRFHPPDERKEGGQLKHVKRVVTIAFSLADAYDLGFYDTDVLIAAAILHDIVKYGDGDEPMNHTWRQHDFMARFYCDPFRLGSGVEQHEFDDIFRAVEGHMGRFSSSPTLRGEKGSLAHLLHVADSLASQAWATINVD